MHHPCLTPDDPTVGQAQLECFTLLIACYPQKELKLYLVAHSALSPHHWPSEQEKNPYQANGGANSIWASESSDGKDL